MVTPDRVVDRIVVVDGERIVGVYPPGREPADVPVEDLGELVLSPGIVDTHVHVNEPGRTEWEGFESATRAAAAGGVTTIVDMPLNSSPVTISRAAFERKLDAARDKCWVDTGFHGGLVPENADRIEDIADAGVLAVKAFLCPSGLDEFPNVDEDHLRAAMPRLARRRLPLFVHAELDRHPAPPVTDGRSYDQYVASRPARWELDAIRLLIDLCRETGCRVHVVHLATAEALPLLKAAREEKLPLTAETCPHYLYLARQEILDGDTRFKCAPPIRRDSARPLWQGLCEGMIDTIGSDHSPCPPAAKFLDEGDFSKAWGGIASLQLTLSAVWACAIEHGMTDPARVAKWLSESPARLIGLRERKGRIAAGADADLVLWDPDQTWRVEAERLHHRHKITPYDGRIVSGNVRRTYVRGNLVYRDGRFADRPTGRLLTRSRDVAPNQT